MSGIDEEREGWRLEVDSVLHEVSEVEKKINVFTSLLALLDSYSIEIPSSIREIRSRGYVFYAGLEDQAGELVDSWLKLRHSFTSIAERLEDDYVPRLRRLRNECERLVDLGPTASGRVELDRVKGSVRDLGRAVGDMVDEASSRARGIERRFSSIKSRVDMALWCTSQLLQASFKLYDGENIVSAYRAKLMGEEKVKGYLYITDKRLVFEAEKEIVLKKVLFIPTKKKKVRELVYDIPIGYVARISRGKVGFFEGGGVYIDFKPSAPVRQLVFDLPDTSIDNLVEDVNYVLSGRADRDRAATLKRPLEKQAPVVIRCPYCGAPIKKEMARGVTSVKCEYCGAVINLG